MDPALFGILTLLCAMVLEFAWGWYNATIAGPRKVKRIVRDLFKDPTFRADAGLVPNTGAMSAADMARLANEKRTENEIRAAATRSSIVAFLAPKVGGTNKAILSLKGLEAAGIVTKHHLSGLADWMPVILEQLDAGRRTVAGQPSSSSELHVGYDR